MNSLQSRYQELRRTLSVREAAEQALQDEIGEAATITPVPGRKGVHLARYGGTKVEGVSAVDAAQKLVREVWDREDWHSELHTSYLDDLSEREPYLDELVPETDIDYDVEPAYYGCCYDDFA